MIQRSFFTRTRVIKLVVTLIPVGLFAWLVNQNYVLTPSVHYQLPIGGTSGVIRIVEPGQVVKIKGQDEWRIHSETLPFYVRIPRLLDRVRISVSGQSTNHPELVLTAKGAPGKSDQSTLIRSSVLDELGWSKVSDEARTVWLNPRATGEKRELPSSVDEFLADLPDSRIGVVNLDPQSIFENHVFTDFSAPRSIGRVFRGQHEFYFGIPAGPLEFSLDKLDLNRKTGKDTMTIVVLQSDISSKQGFREIFRTSIGDDGNRAANSTLGVAQPVRISIPDLRQGVYKIVLETSEDVTWAQLTFRHTFLGFLKRMYVAEGPAYIPGSGFAEFNVITNGTEFGFAPDHNDGFQKITIGRIQYPADRLREKKVIKNLSDITTAKVEKGDIIITSDSLISFPDFANGLDRVPKPVNLNATMPVDGFDYVIAKYIPQIATAPWSITQTYSIEDIRLLGKELVFQLEVPGRKKKEYQISVDQIEATLYRGEFPWDAIQRRLGFN